MGSLPTGGNPGSPGRHTVRVHNSKAQNPGVRVEMSRLSVPIVVLAGSDRSAGELPADAHDLHPLAGYKGMAVRIGGRALIERIVERLRAAEGFDPIYIAGPHRVYREVAGVRLVDTDDSFGRNIRAAMESVRAVHPASPIAFTTCDILPEKGTLERVLAHYARVAPCDLYFPLVRSPEETERLGASGWKPHYRLVPEPGGPAVTILPGHLTIVDPNALRLAFLYQLFELAYRTRNRPIQYRRTVTTRGVLLTLLYQDLLHVFAGRRPTLTWTVLGAGLPAARRLRDGNLTVAALEDYLRRIFVKYRFRQRHPERRVVVPILDELSLALDIDTEEEALARGGEFGQ